MAETRAIDLNLPSVKSQDGHCWIILNQKADTCSTLKEKYFSLKPTFDVES